MLAEPIKGGSGAPSAGHGGLQGALRPPQQQQHATPGLAPASYALYTLSGDYEEADHLTASAAISGLQQQPQPPPPLKSGSAM